MLENGRATRDALIRHFEIRSSGPLISSKKACEGEDTSRIIFWSIYSPHECPKLCSSTGKFQAFPFLWGRGRLTLEPVAHLDEMLHTTVAY